ncbi:MAG: Nif11-like leader peptide family natural product precursor [Parasporobacterium sp.]|nr:Nif11-like leader peptide family natural product precursor [Parasporobacterium sp.]
MNKDAERFMELLKTDKALQDKIAAAAESYAGDKTQEAVFQNVTLPVAEEAGFHFTFDELEEYLVQQKGSVQTLDMDEMDQVAGGTMGGGVGITVCAQKIWALGSAVLIQMTEATFAQFWVMVKQTQFVWE